MPIYLKDVYFMNMCTFMIFETWELKCVLKSIPDFAKEPFRSFESKEMLFGE